MDPQALPTLGMLESFAPAYTSLNTLSYDECTLAEVRLGSDQGRRHSLSCFSGPAMSGDSLGIFPYTIEQSLSMSKLSVTRHGLIISGHISKGSLHGLVLHDQSGCLKTLPTLRNHAMYLYCQVEHTSDG